jgi:hypothetical protein
MTRVRTVDSHTHVRSVRDYILGGDARTLLAAG